MFSIPSPFPAPLGFGGADGAVPVGTVISFAGQVDYLSNTKNTAWPDCNSSTDNPCCVPQSASTLPTVLDSPALLPIEQQGWMLCDGRLLAISQYPALFTVLGNMYGGSADNCVFAIPDCRGLFLRGVDAGAGMDADISQRQAASSSDGSANGVGSLQCDAIQQHQHDYNEPQSGDVTIGTDKPVVQTLLTSTTTELTGDATNAIPPSTTNTVRTSTETRPVNIAMNYLIKTG